VLGFAARCGVPSAGSETALPRGAGRSDAFLRFRRQRLSEYLLGHEPTVRLGISAALFALIVAGEVLFPRRPQQIGRMWRWPNNLGIVLLDAALVRVLFPAALVAVALAAQASGWGILNAIALPGWLAVPLAILALDVAIYFQHRVFHAVPMLWRLHRMHHADLEFDVTTGLRFHPLEILLSLAIKCAVVVVVGAPAVAVVLFEITLNAASLFNHANLRLPANLDRWLRQVLVTPDMHRIHHSIVRRETDSNFGFTVSWWDRLFGTYRPLPAAGQDAMTIGIPLFRDPDELRLDRMLLQPFRRT
jgi:sterol desaturase/sphingolipid hydroxylase (fatty acid hydroxylase superfamily)